MTVRSFSQKTASSNRSVYGGGVVWYLVINVYVYSVSGIKPRY